MCGIFGYVGKKQKATDFVLKGLKTLEYRGYDSWGIAVKKDNTIDLEKHVGKIGNAESTLPESTLGIGHTRWATHGGVTVANAHPHSDCHKQLAVVHNGIVENFQELKEELIAKGHTFASETDSEVIPHLIEEAMKNKGFASAVRDTFTRLQGMNAFVAMSAPSKEIIAAKTGSPLVIGIGKDAYFIASDASGIAPHTKEVIFLEDNQMVILGEKLQLLELPDGNEIEPIRQTLDWQFENAQLGKYPHFLLKEINEQPQTLEYIAQHGTEEANKLAILISQAFGTFLLGCGTASYAGLAGTYLFSTIAKKHVNFTIGSEFEYLEDYITDKSLIIPISQSGETIDIVDPVSKAKQRGATIAALVNVQGSTLYRQADFQFLLSAGQEKAVIATKSFTAMIATLLLTAYTLADRQEEGSALITEAANNITELLQDNTLQTIQKLAYTLKNREHMYLLGRGLSYATAMEATLKIKETSYVHAEGFAGGELKHGVMALIEKGTPCFIFAPNDKTYNEIISNAQEVKARGAYVIGVGPKNNQVFDTFIQTADIQEATMIPQIVVSQLFAYYLALARGITDPDKPRNLAKSVTVK